MVTGFDDPVLRSSDSPLLPRRAGPYLDPPQRSSVLLALSLSLFAAIQHCTSVIHTSEVMFTSEEMTSYSETSVS